MKRSLSCVPPTAVQFAVALLGDQAADYLSRYYRAD